jgi:hypothetical protein
MRPAGGDPPLVREGHGGRARHPGCGTGTRLGWRRTAAGRSVGRVILSRAVGRCTGALAALALALPFAGCGDDDGAGGPGPGSGGTPATSAVPSTGVAAESPEDVTACLEEGGFTVTRETTSDEAGSAVGLEDRLVLVGGPRTAGIGSIEYFATEEQAFEANKAALDGQETGSVVGRTGAAVYVFRGDGLDEARPLILGCL